MVKSLTLILGGARSGKSTYALDLARRRSQELATGVLFVATATAFDDEMAARIAAHKAERGAERFAKWQTLEAPTALGQALRAHPNRPGIVLVDCLTLLANNVLLSLPDPEVAAAAEVAEAASAALGAEIDELLAVYAADRYSEWIVVSNEVGLGLVPPYPLGRIYRDELGRANQRLAQVADRVLFMVAGLPMTVK